MKRITLTTTKVKKKVNASELAQGMWTFMNVKTMSTGMFGLIRLVL